ncbi:molybdopterin biosynthesis MoaE protein [Desulfurobacterium thermolithotrophum DSM 11699]|uniref:Molybdopterin synthase catalytic subunit n=1 Tax=Desulfurobacterium thermolithotrophum (strain DSM 11699 / BSA) TaxID=868864 RepID=F0S3P0_DESTD|nr:molybdenum cofactor biosynthesis protein MoaE [Desulfurobacterium thermolithotrophum]ADY73462.1 molybdopterin biosynthesis MoaE protein [Desulfurobacterium thermolithotrophum DSM 11699]
MRSSVDKLLEEIKKNSNPENLGMVLVHNGIVREISRTGKKIKEMELSFDEEKLKKVVSEFEKKKGIEAIKVWINKGRLKIGDDIMVVIVAGKFRKDVVPVFEELLSKIKEEVVVEKEIQS